MRMLFTVMGIELRQSIIVIKTTKPRLGYVGSNFGSLPYQLSELDQVS